MIFIFMIIVMIMPFTFVRSHCNIIERKIVSGKCFFLLPFSFIVEQQQPRIRGSFYFLSSSWCLTTCEFVFPTTTSQHCDGNDFEWIFNECSFRSIQHPNLCYRIHRFQHSLPVLSGDQVNQFQCDAISAFIIIFSLLALTHSCPKNRQFNLFFDVCIVSRCHFWHNWFN